MAQTAQSITASVAWPTYFMIEQIAGKWVGFGIAPPTDAKIKCLLKVDAPRLALKFSS